MLSRTEKDFLKKQVESAVTASIKLYGVTGSEEGMYLLSDSFIKGQLKRERLGEKKIGEMAKGLRLLGCEVKVYGLTPAMIEYRFNINKIPLTAAQADLMVEQIGVRNRFKEQTLALLPAGESPSPMFINLRNIPIIVKSTADADLDDLIAKTKNRVTEASKEAFQDAINRVDKFMKDNEVKTDRTDIGVIIREFDIATIDPRNFENYMLSIFPDEDDRSEIIDGDTLETKMIFSADNYVKLPTGEWIGHIRFKSHTGNPNHHLLCYDVMPTTAKEGEEAYHAPELKVEEVLTKCSDDRFLFEVNIFRAYRKWEKEKANAGREKQPPPNEAWCVGCNPDNCSCCYVPPYTPPSEKGDL